LKILDHLISEAPVLSYETSARTLRILDVNIQHAMCSKNVNKVVLLILCILYYRHLALCEVLQPFLKKIQWSQNLWRLS